MSTANEEAVRVTPNFRYGERGECHCVFIPDSHSWLVPEMGSPERQTALFQC